MVIDDDELEILAAKPSQADACGADVAGPWVGNMRDFKFRAWHRTAPECVVISCETCTDFDEYEEGHGRNEDNCTTWLRNCGGCPKDASS